MGPHRHRHRASGSVPRVDVAALAAAVLLAAAGCAGASGDGATNEPVSVSVHQSRSNVAARQLSIAVTNDADGPIEITGARFVSDQFVSDAVWPKDSTTIRPGVTADLPVPLPAADCAAANLRHIVELTYRITDDATGEGSGASGAGGTHSVSIEPTDPLGQLEPLFAADCLREAAGEIAVLSISAPPRLVESAGAVVAHLDVAATPTGGRGSLTVDAAHGTTLFSQLDPETGAATDNRKVDVTVQGAAPPSVITLELAPSRCDPHAVAEDKLGTVFPLEVTVTPDAAQSLPGTITVAASDDVRAALYAFVDQSCQW